MSDENVGQEDTVLGSALRRAIETQPLRATPYGDSRIAMRLAGRERRSPLVPLLAAAAAVVLGLALGAALLGQRGQDPGGVASSPTPSPDGTPGATSGPIAEDPNRDRVWVYFARDQLPVVGAFVGSIFDDRSAESRIQSRVSALYSGVEASELPPGTINPVATLGDEERRPDGTTSRSFELSVRVEGDLATVEFGPNHFERIKGAAATQAVLEQLVYTISEEPGVRRVLLKERGKNELTIDQLVIDKPLSREDVLPYEGVRTEPRIELTDDPRASTATARARPQDIAGGARFVIQLDASQTPEEGFWSPAVTAELIEGAPQDLPGKWTLRVEIPGARDANAPLQLIENSPLRGFRTITDMRPEASPGRTTYFLALDDARPWRLSLEPSPDRGTMFLIVDIGGHPQAISDGVAVYGPVPGSDVARTFTLTGAARAFEAHVAWRLKDASQREVATGFATASIGTSPVWGTFTTEVRVPDGVTGNVTLEVFWPSPRDGADLDTVAIPLRVR